MGDGTGTEPNQSTDITTAQAAAMSRVWDPVMAAQLTRGGMCCDALYYGDAGVGRPTIAEVGSVSEFEPPLAGGVMAAESPVGTMCPMHGSGNGYSTRSTLRRRCFSKARPSTYLLHHPSTACPSLLPLLRRKRQTKLSRSSARRTSHP